MLTSTKQQGLTLIEVLIATVVLAFGLLGIAGMQLAGMRASQSSYQRTQAMALLNDFAERIRANPEGAKSGQYAQFNSDTYATACTSPPTICAKEYGGSSSVSCSDPATGPFNGKALADYDKFVTVCGVPGNGIARGTTTAGMQSILPGASLRVYCWSTTTSTGTPFDNRDASQAQCTAGSRLRVTITWQDRGDIRQMSSAARAASTATVGTTVASQTLELWIQP